MVLALKTNSFNLKDKLQYLEHFCLAIIWLFYFLSINVEWTEPWIKESFLPESVAPHTAIAIPIIFLINVFWLIPKFLNRKNWYIYISIGLGSLLLFELVRALLFTIYLLNNESFVTLFIQELIGKNNLLLGELYFLSTNVIFWSFIYRFTRDWIIHQSTISSLVKENEKLKRKGFLEKKVKEPTKVFFIKKRNSTVLLEDNSIIYFKAQGDFVLAIDSNNRKHILNESLKNINNQIDNQLFFQVNRGEIINRTFVTKINPYIKNRVEIVLKNCSSSIYTSNSRTPKFRAWISNNKCNII